MTATCTPRLTGKLSIGEYLALDAVNWSLLRLMESHSPAHARQEMLHPKEPTKHMGLGDMTHAALLQPDVFAKRFVTMQQWLEETDEGRAAHAAFVTARMAAKHTKAGDVDSYDRQTTEGKAVWRAFEQANPGRTLVSVEEYARVRGMMEAVQANTTASRLLYGPGRSEVTGIWEHKGVPCKVRADRLTEAFGFKFDVEVKTIHSADDRSVKSALETYGYHGQAAMRLTAWREIAGGGSYPQRIVHIFVETSPPYGVRVLELGERSMSTGQAMFERAVAKWGECLASGVWPGYPDAIEPVDLRRWALDEPQSSDDLADFA